LISIYGWIKREREREREDWCPDGAFLFFGSALHQYRAELCVHGSIIYHPLFLVFYVIGRTGRRGGGRLGAGRELFEELGF
jgi:hypothetical protein